MSEPRRSRLSRLLRLLGVAAAMAALAMIGLHLLAGPAGLPADGWRSHAPPPPPLASARGDFELQAKPLSALIDEPVRIEVSGLQPGEEVILQAGTRDAADVEFRSWARFHADEDGRLDAARAAPIDGTYSGEGGDGLLWSMGAAGDPPFFTARSWRRREIEIRAETARGVRLITVTRIYPWHDLDFEEVAEKGVTAEFWAPPEGAALPAVIKLGGSGGGTDPLGSALLAARGFAVLDLRYHDGPGLPDELVEIPVETVSRGIDWLQRHGRVDPRRIGVLGVSKGAELALLAASVDRRIHAVAAWAPSSVVFRGISFRDPRPGSSWTLAGTPLPYADAPFDFAALRNFARILLRRPVSFRQAYGRALALTEKSGATEPFLPVERICGPILLAAGTDDQMWPAGRMLRQIVDRLEHHAFPYEVTTILEPGAGHRLSYALWPSGGGPSRQFVRGGSPESSHRAGRSAWRETQAFFREALTGGPAVCPPSE